MFLALRVLLIFGCFQNISPSRIHGKRYIISEEMNDKVSTDMGKPFPSGNQSLLQCVAHCGFAGGCESVSYSPSSCNGYSVVHSSISPNLILMPGARYFANEDVTQNSLHNPALESCAELSSQGYVWNETIGKCCHFQNSMLNVIEARVRCMSEASNSGLLLIDSEEIYNFAVDTLKKYDIGTMYVQGTLFDGNFVDDNGILIVYFKWLEGEPTRGYYLRIDPLTYRQKTTYGTSSYNSMCCLL